MTIETSAWRGTGFRLPDGVPSMLAPEEREYLYWLGRSVWRGQGDVVEIGPWLGGSTTCLAAGMREAGHDATGRLKAFDNFIWRAFMAERADLPIAPGESFEPFFLKNLAAYGDVVSSYRRALPDETIAGDGSAGAQRYAEVEGVPLFERVGDAPVELLFIDGAKSWRGMLFLLRTLRDGLVPGVTHLVCQDYKYWSCYWVPLMLSMLGDCVAPVHNVRGGTTVTFRLASDLPADLLAGLPDHVGALDAADGAARLDACAARLGETGDRAGALHLALAKVSFLAHQRRPEAALDAFRAVQARWDSAVPTGQLERAREYLGREFSLTAPLPAGKRMAVWWAGWMRRMRRMRRA